ncbi:hypothetical protein MIAR_27190 [Microbacterium arabinogalactanolyticum]|nr:hypothetical protein MIAR_27190 [Microbacterium arabinogalactanolyticum]
MFVLSLLDGMVTESWCAEFALRRRVSMSATGSVIVMVVSFVHEVPAAVTRQTACYEHGVRADTQSSIVRDVGRDA